MTKYVCKCGRIVHKSTNADNTGNRETDGCEGCPYLLPWGPTKWDDTRHAIVVDVKGYECRMSKDLEYSTRFCGSITDKCSCYIASLDFDFLAHVSEWIEETYPDRELCGHFSINTIRAVEYVSNGRYRMSIVCAQNKKGIAAKAALMHRFFDENGARIDMTPEEEKAHILAAINAGKARVQKGKEKKVKYIISEHQNGLMYAYYKNLFWFWDKGQEKWISSSFAEQRYKQALQKDSKLTPEIFMDSGDFYTLDEYEIPMQRRIALETLTAADCKAAEDSCSCAGCKRADCTCAGMKDAEGRAECDGSGNCKQSGCSYNLKHQENPTQAAPASPAGAGAATQNLSAADPASLEAESVPAAFDYTGLDEPTRDALHWAEREIGEARRDYIARLAQAVCIAHDALCGGVVQNLDNSKHGNRGDEAFVSWCASVGLKRSTAYNLLQVNALLSSSTPEEQEVLEAASPSLLYAAAKPSAPAELVQAVKDGDITTHKQYQDALAEIRKRDAKIQELLEMSEASDRRADEAQAWAKKVQHEAELDRKEREDAHSAAMHYKAECDRREREQQRIEGLLNTREEELRQERQRVKALEARPVEVAVQEPTEEQIAAAAKQRTAMLEAQVRSLQADKDSALRQLDELGNTAYMAAAEFADNAARTVDSIRTAFWALAKELSGDDFAEALAPLDEAVRKIYEREWDDEESEA